ncbi:MAG: response regulator [Sphingobacteriales bacterium]|nr:response regulator [Sphingobacteriales bacterium]
MRKTILIICGSKPMSYLLQTVLSARYDFIAVADVYTGMSYVRKNSDISMVIVDIDSQEKESFEFIEYIKSSVLYQKPVFVLSGQKPELNAKSLADLKADVFINKPFSPPDLLKRVEYHLHTEMVNN